MWFLIILSIKLLFAQNKGDDFVGYWMDDTNTYIVKVTRDETIYNGKVVWMKDSLDKYKQPLRDVMNDDPEKRSRLVKDINVLDGFVFDSGLWKSGVVYNYQSGNDYNGRLKIDDDGNLRLTGYYGILFFLGKTKVWTPVYNKAKYGLK